MKRGGPLKRRTRLSPGKVRLKRTQMKRAGKRREREAAALAEFKQRPLSRVQPELGVCDECGPTFREAALLDAHHLCSRARGAGHPMLHDTRNRAWLCAQCHRDAHEGRKPHLIKRRDFLDQLLQSAGPSEGPTDRIGLESGETPPREVPADTYHETLNQE